MDVSQLIHEDACQCMLHNCQLWDKLGQKISGHEASNGKVVALYFTSNWCEPCHTFTRSFVQAYDGIQHRTNELTVVNIPLENDQSQADLSYSRMPPQWFTMEVESKQTKFLANEFSIRTVPRLVVCKADGTVLSSRGRQDVENKLAAGIASWIDAAHAKPKQLTHGFDLDEEVK